MRTHALRYPPRVVVVKYFIYRAMSDSVSYAAAVSTPNGRIRQPQIEARACSQDDSRTSFDASLKPQRPGAGIRAKTSFRGWSKKPEKSERAVSYQPGPVQELHPTRHVTRDEHKPKTGSDQDDVYVLTMKLSDSIAQPMNQLREAYFPKRLNRTPAHLTLFHALPHSEMEKLEQSLTDMAFSTQPFEISSGRAFPMRKGVGINVDSGYRQLKEVHKELQSQWQSFLSEQDAGGFRPHWTAMNKVDDKQKVDDAFEAIKKTLSHGNHEGQALGLDLWRYDRGNWEWYKEFLFGGLERTTSSSQVRPPSNRKEQGTTKIASEPSVGDGQKRPGMWKRGSSVGDALRSISFRRKS